MHSLTLGRRRFAAFALWSATDVRLVFGVSRGAWIESPSVRKFSKFEDQVAPPAYHAQLVELCVSRGVDREVAEGAYLRAVDDGDLDPDSLLREAVAARLKRERDLDAGALRRVYNALLRAGFPAAGLYAELKRQRDALDLAEHEYHDESP